MTTADDEAVTCPDCIPPQQRQMRELASWMRSLGSTSTSVLLKDGTFVQLRLLDADAATASQQVQRPADIAPAYPKVADGQARIIRNQRRELALKNQRVQEQHEIITDLHHGLRVIMRIAKDKDKDVVAAANSVLYPTAEKGDSGK